jgi:hypothetical protein
MCLLKYHPQIYKNVKHFLMKKNIKNDNVPNIHDVKLVIQHHGHDMKVRGDRFGLDLVK